MVQKENTPSDLSQEWESDQNMRICMICKEGQKGDDNRWIICERPLHLQCCRIRFEKENCYNIDIPNYYVIKVYVKTANQIKSKNYFLKHFDVILVIEKLPEIKTKHFQTISKKIKNRGKQQILFSPALALKITTENFHIE